MKINNKNKKKMELDWKIDPQSLLPEPYNRIYESEVGKDGTKQKSRIKVESSNGD